MPPFETIPPTLPNRLELDIRRQENKISLALDASGQEIGNAVFSAYQQLEVNALDRGVWFTDNYVIRRIRGRYKHSLDLRVNNPLAYYDSRIASSINQIMNTGGFLRSLQEKKLTINFMDTTLNLNFELPLCAIIFRTRSGVVHKYLVSGPYWPGSVSLTSLMVYFNGDEDELTSDELEATSKIVRTSDLRKVDGEMISTLEATLWRKLRRQKIIPRDIQAVLRARDTGEVEIMIIDTELFRLDSQIQPLEKRYKSELLDINAYTTIMPREI